MEERRKDKRTHIEWPIYLRSRSNHRQIGGVDDISLSGLKIHFSEDAIPIEDTGHFDLYLCRMDNPMDLLNITGKPVWIRKNKPSLLMGLEVNNMTERAKAMLRDFISHQEKLSLEMDLEI